MRTRAKKQHVASDRARRGNVPKAILLVLLVRKLLLFQNERREKKMRSH